MVMLRFPMLRCRRGIIRVHRDAEVVPISIDRADYGRSEVRFSGNIDSRRSRHDRSCAARRRDWISFLPIVVRRAAICVRSGSSKTLVQLNVIITHD